MCGKVSISFDPFNILSLPIPQATKDIQFKIKYYPLSLMEPAKEFIFHVGEYATLSEIKTRIHEAVGGTGAIPYIGRIKNKQVVELLDKEKFIKTYIERGDEICAYQRIDVADNIAQHYMLSEMKFTQVRRSYFLFSGL